MRSTTSPQIFRGRRQQQVHRAADRAFGRILDRHDGVVGVTGLDLAEDIIDGRLRQQARRMAEMLGRRRLGEGAQRAEEGDAERLFERQAGRHHLAEEEGDVLARAAGRRLASCRRRSTWASRSGR